MSHLPRTATPEAAGESSTRLDLLMGAPAIAAFLGVKPRTVYHLAERFARTGEGMRITSLPGFGLVASRATLRAYMEQHVGTVEEVNIES